MKYYLSHVRDCMEHKAQFVNGVEPYALVAQRAYVTVTGQSYVDVDGLTQTPKTRSTADCQSVALIAVADSFEPLSGQTLYGITELETVKQNHPLIDYAFLGRAWVNGVLIP